MTTYRHKASGEIASEAWKHDGVNPAPDWLADRMIDLGGFRSGDWFTLDKFGLVDIWTADDFAAKFEPIKEEPKP